MATHWKGKRFTAAPCVRCVASRVCWLTSSPQPPPKEKPSLSERMRLLAEAQGLAMAVEHSSHKNGTKAVEFHLKMESPSERCCFGVRVSVGAGAAGLRAGTLPGPGQSSQA